jgi:hypothetical protein
MPYTALVLDEKSHLAAWQAALALNLIFTGGQEFLHHVTIGMGDLSRELGARMGATESLVVTHFGQIAGAGRVSAFKVSHLEGCRNATPHLTISTLNAKPRESNEITEWTELAEKFIIEGRIEVCQ